MPSITVKLERVPAVELHNIIGGMEGEANYKAARQQVQKAITKAWPETEDGEATGPGISREVELNPKQQRALAEGFLTLANNSKTTNRDYEFIQKVARTCRVWGWVEQHITEKPVPDFEGELDGEPDLVDAEPFEFESEEMEPVKA